MQRKLLVSCRVPLRPSEKLKGEKSALIFGAANTLSPRTELAQVLFQNAGPSLEADCRIHASETHKLTPGKIVATLGHGTGYDNLVHVVVPVYEGPQNSGNHITEYGLLIQRLMIEAINLASDFDRNYVTLEPLAHAPYFNFDVWPFALESHTITGLLSWAKANSASASRPFSTQVEYIELAVSDPAMYNCYRGSLMEKQGELDEYGVTLLPTKAVDVSKIMRR